MERENTVLVYCAKENPTEFEIIELVRLVQDDGINLNFADRNGMTPLLQLCKKNRNNFYSIPLSSVLVSKAERGC